MRRLATALAATAALTVAGCGDDGPGGATASQRPLVVSAAASLREPLTACSGDARLSFAGSDELAAQIRQGLRPDVFAAANTKLPTELAREGRLEQPRTFIGNELVIAVPAASDVRGLADLEGDATLAVGAEGVPVGDYTRDVLDRLPAARRRAILDGVRSEEPDVKGVVGKLTQGAVDAGFVYASDVRGAGGRLRAIALPGALQPTVAYAVAVVRGAKHPEAARAFVRGLLSGRGRRALEAAGFTPPPRG